MKKTNTIKTYEDACAALGIDPSQTIQFPNTQNDLLIGISAFAKLLIVAQALNEGWQPDWSNYNEYKYYPWFNMDDDNGSGLYLSFHGCGFVRSLSLVGSRLVFRSSELATYAGKQFIELYAQAFVKKA